MSTEPGSEPRPGLASRGLLAVAAYVLWLVSAVVGLAGLFALRRLADVVLAIALGRGGDGAAKWSGPATIVVTIVAGVALLVLILIWEDRYQREARGGLGPLLRRFGRVTAVEAGVIGAMVALSFLLLRVAV